MICFVDVVIYMHLDCSFNGLDRHGVDMVCDKDPPVTLRSTVTAAASPVRAQPE